MEYSLVEFVAVEQDIHKILLACDQEFLPPLSTRSSTTQKDLTSANDLSNQIGISSYLEGLSTQKTLVSVKDNEVVGFMSFITRYSCNEIGEYAPSNHVTTLCVLPTARGQGITKKFYEFLFNSLPEELACQYVTTRTWSTNLSHLKILDSFNFVTLHKIENDRGDNVSTLYLGKKIF